MTKLERIDSRRKLEKVFAKDFFDTYSECFGGAPYFETFRKEDVFQEFLDYAENGIFYALLDQFGNTLAFVAGCAAVDEQSDAIEIAMDVMPKFISEYNLETFFFVSEIGVRRSFQSLGFARTVGEALLTEIKDNPEQWPQTTFITRTHIKNNNSLNMHKNFGFHRIMVSEHQATEKPDDRRVFFLKDIREITI